ncbi:hypothetical protein AN477_11950 [Alicyclobacillus ferrooxydans]|uniref:Uncharacterized protein n=2 Tax=Alicyclobacillus ferrooxydans TaxID=471514 RepID=A0A0P9CD25_9BACL|nr:hypothetical protein AN477_11950 [Alicyclobacillus ferrooxydans]
MMKQADPSFQEFLRIVRRVSMVVLLAWVILSVGKLVKLEPSRDPFAPPNPPFQAVASTGWSAHNPARSKIELVAQQLVSGVWQTVLYGAK